MARRRRLTPAQPGYLEPAPQAADAQGAGWAPQAGGPPIAQVSGQSAEAAALREITAGLQEARETGRMIVDVPLADIAQSYLARDRVALERTALDALKASIRAHGQRTPAEITPLVTPAPTVQPEDAESAAAGDALSAGGVPPYRFGLISGWRRLRALSELCDETGDTRFSTLRALIRPPAEAAESYVAMVEENEIRVGLSYYERARVTAEAVVRGVFPDQTAALRTLFATASRAKRSKIASFIEIHEALGDLLKFPAEIPERLGLALVARLRLGDHARIRAALAETLPASAAAELALLEKLARPPRAELPRRPEAELLGQGVSMRIARKGRTLTLTLSGERVDDALLTRVQEAMRRLPD